MINQKMNKMVLMIVGALSVGSMNYANAAEDNVLIQRVNIGKLTQIGVPGGALNPLKGFAKDMPLITVMRQITPAGWAVKKDDSQANPLDINMLVSWDGGKNWVETLGMVTQAYGVNAQVDWNVKEIVLSPVDKPAQKAMAQVVVNKLQTPSVDVPAGDKIAVFEMDMKKPEVKEKSGEVAQVKSESADAIQVSDDKNTVKTVADVANGLEMVPVWKLDRTLTLKENVEQWANKVGYKVVWLGEDYEVSNETYKGNFDSKDGPIQQLAEDYGPKSRVKVPLAFQFYQNQTLVVENRKFEQNGFPQYFKK